MAFIQDSKKKKVTAKPQGIFEALKDIGDNVVSAAANELVVGSAQSALDQLLGKTPASAPESRANQSFFPQEATSQKIEAAKQQERLFFERKRRDERLIYSQQEEQIAQEIIIIQNELKRIAEETRGIEASAKELKIVALQPIAKAGVYHLTFLQRIRELLILTRKKIQESKTWLELFLQRHKRKSHYWFMVGKKGTSYMLSPERYMSTQAG